VSPPPSTGAATTDLPGVEAETERVVEGLRTRGLALDLAVIAALWRRDMLHLVRERSRWIGVIVQPLIFWALIGTGMSGVFRLYGGEGNYLAYFFPGILAMVVLFTAVFATMSVIEDRQRGFLQQVLVVPSGRASLVLGKIAGVTTMAAIQVAITTAVAPLAGIPLWGVNWPLLFGALVLGCVALTALNFMLAWVVNSTGGYHGVMAIVMLPLWVLSGAMFPAETTWQRVAMALNPMAYMVDGMRHALEGGRSEVANFAPLTCLAVLAALCILFVGLAVRVVNRRAHGART